MSAERPALYEHCTIVWEAMAEEAIMQTLDGVDALVYTGFLTKLFEAKLLSIPYYTQVMNALKRMDCVRQLRRGGGAAPSEWVLVQKPSLELFRSRMDLPAPATSRKQGLEQAQQMVRDLAKRVSDLENRVQYLESTGGHNG